MTHFTVGAIIPKDYLMWRLQHEEGDDPDLQVVEGYIKEWLELALDPFDENKSVLYRKEDCYCVGKEAKRYGEKMAAIYVGTISEIRDRMMTIYEKIMTEKYGPKFRDHDFTGDAIERDGNKIWKDLTADAWKEHEETVRNYAEYHPMYAKPKPNCDMCHGTGIDYSRYNPNSKWDWWSIGGRWDGSFYENAAADQKVTSLLPAVVPVITEESGSNGDLDIPQPPLKHKPRRDASEIEKNAISVKAYMEGWTAEEGLRTYRCYGYISTDGKWYSKGRMGWFGMSHGDMTDDAWEATVVELMKANLDNYIVLLDLHI